MLLVKFLRARIVHLVLELCLLLQLPCVLNTKPMLEDLSDVLESHPFDFRVAEVNCDPTEEANCSIESKSTCELLVVV